MCKVPEMMISSKTSFKIKKKISTKPMHVGAADDNMDQPLFPTSSLYAAGLTSSTSSSLDINSSSSTPPHSTSPSPLISTSSSLSPSSAGGNVLGGGGNLTATVSALSSAVSSTLAALAPAQSQSPHLVSSATSLITSSVASAVAASAVAAVNAVAGSLPEGGTSARDSGAGGVQMLPSGPDSEESKVGDYFIKTGRRYVDKSLSSFLPITTLRSYFQVNNSYVYYKLRMLLLPFLHKGTWVRQAQHTDDGSAVYLPPKGDINAPDLYIPTMSFVTYVLVVAFVLGIRGKFAPEILGLTASSGLVTLLLELAFIKFMFYLVGAASIAFVDLVAYCGYIFVPVVVTMFMWLFFGRYGYYSSILIFGFFQCYVMNKTLGSVLLVDPVVEGDARPSHHAPRRTVLLVISGLQVLLTYFLSCV
ncbi:Protein transport protein yif1 [Pelomyxa schiedti]|nr:Protein transport protein yif1 [Pelomyxa schiedti]